VSEADKPSVMSLTRVPAITSERNFT
jgi:hypothetical protein